METIREWAMAVCAAAVAGGLFHMMLPNGGTAKLVKLTVSVFFICCLLSPLLFMDNSFSLELERYNVSQSESLTLRLEEAAEKSFVLQAQQDIERIVAGRLAAGGITCKKIEASINTDGQSSISFNEVVVTVELDDDKWAQDVERIVWGELGLSPRIVYPSGGS